MLDMLDSLHRNCDIASSRRYQVSALLHVYSGALMAAGMGIAEKTGFGAAPATYAQPDMNPALHYNQLKTGYRIAFGLPITLLLAAFFAFFAVNDQPSTSSTHEESKNVELSVEAGGEMAAENNVEEPKDD